LRQAKHVRSHFLTVTQKTALGLVGTYYM